MRNDRCAIGRISFSWQIVALISFGILALAVIGSITTAFFINKKLSDIVLDQGRQITATLAHQSILPLLSAVGTNAREDVDATLGYSSVRAIVIFDKDGELVISAGDMALKNLTKPPVGSVPFNPVITYVSDEVWEFTAAVYDVDLNATESDISFDQLYINAPELLGYVSVMIDRTNLYKIQSQILQNSMLIFTGLSLLLMVIAVIVSRQITRPLYQLAGLMKRAEEGQEGIRASPDGPLEIHDMARAFNAMMDALEQRHAYAEEQHDFLVREIDERQLIEQELRESENRLVTIFNNVVDGILVLDSTGVIESANPVALYMLRSAENITGECFCDVVNGLMIASDSTLRMDVSSFFEDCFSGCHFSMRGDGAPLEIDIKFSEMNIKGSKKYIAIIRDITETQQQKNRIESLLAQHETMISSVPGIIMELDNSGKVLWCNKHAEQVVGYSATEFKGRNIAHSVVGDDRKNLMEAIATSCNEGRSELHAELMTVNGMTPYQFNMAHMNVMAESEGTLLMVGLNDSQSVMAQLALKKARDAALESARIKSEFLANMSHEIRTPMNGMFGMLQLLSESELNEGQKSYAEIALRSADQLLNIINDILDFSKIEAGKLELDRIKMSPRTVIEDAVELFSQRAQSKGVQIYSNVAVNVPEMIFGDPTRITQIISNLIGNSVKFTDHGHIMVSCSVSYESVELFSECHLVIAVEDTGIGIDMGSQGRIFESFIQADGSSTRRYSGTGLGLAIVRQLSELMGGGVVLKSVPEKGSEFIVTLPISMPVDGQDSLTTPIIHDYRTAIYVGDDYVVASVLRDYLISMGYCLDVVAPNQSFDGDALFPRYDLYLIDYYLDSDAMIKWLLGKALRVIVMVNQNEKGRQFAQTTDSTLLKLIKPVRYHALLACLKQEVMPTLELVTAVKEYDSAKLSANKKLRILVVEDNETNQRVINAMLENLGYHAVNIYDGRDAVEKMKQEQFDIVFMDCQMPVMDGYQATIEIRRNEIAGGHSTIIAMTGNAMEGDRDKCLAVGMDDYIAKPVRLTVLQEVISRWSENINER